MLKSSIKSNLKENGFILAHSSKRSSLGEKVKMENFKQLVLSYPVRMGNDVCLSGLHLLPPFYTVQGMSPASQGDALSTSVNVVEIAPTIMPRDLSPVVN